MAQTERIRQRRPLRGQSQDQPTSRKSHPQEKSFLSNCCKQILYIDGVLFLMLVIYLMLKSTPVDPEAYRLPPPRPWTGPLAENNKLQQGKRLVENKVFGPESLALKNGRLYTGTVDGKVVEISNEKDVKVVARLGGSTCGDTMGEEERCGRPLAVRFIDEKLYVMDAFFGLYQLDITGGNLPKQLVSTKTSHGGHTMKFANDFEQLDNGTFLFSDTSHKWHMTQNGLLVLENKACGRLLWYDPETKTSGVVKDGLYSPNGIQLSPKKDFLLIAESTRYRISKYYVKGPKAGKTEIFSDNLPGMPDNISPSRNGGYWVGFALANSRMGPMKMDVVAPLPWLRKIVAKLVDPTSLVSYMPQYGLIIELNQKGEIVQSLHDPSGKVVPSVSEVLDTGDALYLGSYHSPFIVKVDL
ncbi:adipocyte plasma membrane-associated protein [Strongylocentrotus purpuratus]|uniref:Strictosidine synthase conserved region domain-containing protein n=1 Tax=Strongylocentrotus purpuratus TaxID=7668 RepID=A0A7M7NSP8_STRPU|nr:adipocyte plasma membrane-associated protein [Strongylocentrotus purpuratus]